jgi:hypothetical protein
VVVSPKLPKNIRIENKPSLRARLSEGEGRMKGGEEGRESLHGSLFHSPPLPFGEPRSQAK